MLSKSRPHVNLNFVLSPQSRSVTTIAWKLKTT